MGSFWTFSCCTLDELANAPGEPIDCERMEVLTRAVYPPSCGRMSQGRSPHFVTKHSVHMSCMLTKSGLLSDEQGIRYCKEAIASHMPHFVHCHMFLFRRVKQSKVRESQQFEHGSRTAFSNPRPARAAPVKRSKLPATFLGEINDKPFQTRLLQSKIDQFWGNQLSARKTATWSS